MVAAAPVMPTKTLYPSLGDIVGQLSLTGVVLTIVAVIARRFRRPRRAQAPGVADAA